MKASLAFIFASVLLPPLVADDDIVSPPSDEASLSNSTSIGSRSETIEARTKAITSQAAARGAACLSSRPEERNHDENTMRDRNDGSVGNHEVADTASQRMMEDESLTRLPSDLKYYFHQYEDNRAPFVWSPESAVHLHQHQYKNHVVIPPYRPFSIAPRLPSWDVLSKVSGERKERAKYRSNRTSGLQSETSDNLTTGSTDDNRAMKTSSKDEESISPKLHAEKSMSEGAAVGSTGAYVKISVGDMGDASKLVDGASPSSDTVPEEEQEQQRQDEEDLVVVDYAGKSGGALIIEKSSGWKGTSNLLTGDNDQYAMVPVEAKNKSLIISLSEEILVKTVILSNYERYSSNVKEFQILGSQTMAKWADLGRYTAKPGKFGRQVFELGEFANWARYLKLRFLSHYGDEHYLTITQISVYGTTMQQGFHEHWDEQRIEDNEEEEIKFRNDKGPEQVKAPASDSSSDFSFSERNTTSIDTEESGDLTYTKRAAEGKTSSTRVSSCSSCQARGLGNNGYLLFSWAMPVAKIETACQWTALSSASVQVQSSAIRPLRKTTFLADPRVAKTPSFFARRKMVDACCARSADCKTRDSGMENIHASLTSRTLPRLDLQEMSPALKKILNRTENETGNQVSWNDIKTVLVAHSAASNLGLLSGGTTIHKAKEKDQESPETGVEPESTKSSDMPGRGKKEAEKKIAESHSLTKPKSTATNGADQKAGANTVDSPVHHPVSKDQGVSIGTQIMEDNPFFSVLLERIPSASCLSELDIALYKATHSRSSPTGAPSNSPSGGGMEPIFKKLTDEIKSLQASLSVHDKYAKESVACFQRVLLDLLIHQEKERAEQSLRLEHLENILDGTFLYHALWDIFSALSSIISTAYYYYMTENLFVGASEINWNDVRAWVQENMRPSFVGFPLSLLCMVLYRRGRNKRALRNKAI